MIKIIYYMKGFFLNIISKIKERKFINHIEK